MVKSVSINPNSGDNEVKEIRNPFPGLRAFNLMEKHLFFGRDGQSEKVLELLTSNRFIAIIGPSGAGKSTLIRCINRLVNPSSGQVLLDGTNLVTLNRSEIRKARRRIGMIFQEPMTSLNPVLKIGDQLSEPFRLHTEMSKKEAWNQATEMLKKVGIPAAGKRVKEYPHQMSGGMRQRVMIAMALVCRPKLLIADEPTTALDVTIQAQILSLMLSLKSELNMSVLMITHDLGVVAQTASRVVVMYAGQIIEEGQMIDIFDQPFHPYTQGLLKSMPRLGDRRGRHAPRLNEIPGTVPALIDAVVGCRFADRCPHVFEACRQKQPELFKIDNGQRARCWLKRHPDRRKPSA